MNEIQPHVTPVLQSVDVQTSSVLPTGRLKIVDRKVFHEVMVIVHKASAVRQTGVYTEWIQMSDADTKALLMAMSGSD
ncbi:MAG: hypothetical protein KGI49_02535 [Patescibacteria group bacterium]|nr:hypothetical protein [Patescibacteria group bacterium]